LVTRELKKKKMEDDATLEKIGELVRGIEVPASSIVREDAGEVAQEVFKATKAVPELASSEAKKILIKVSTDGSEGVQEDQAAGSEAAAPEAITGIPSSPHSHTVVEIGSDSTQSTSSQSTSSLNSSELDDLPIGLVFQTNKKGQSSTTKTYKKPSQTIPFEPMVPSINERIGEISDMRNIVCERLPLNHPLQPQIIQPLNMVVPDEVHVKSSSSQPPSTNQTQDTTVLDNLVSHYSGELPEVRLHSEKASEVASVAVAYEEVTSESPQQQTPNTQIAPQISSNNITNPEHVSTFENVSVPKQVVYEQIQLSTIPLPETIFIPTCLDNSVSIATSMDIDSEDDQSDP
jgi:hypothetical protein